MKAAAVHCTACPLYLHATQTVFGEGALHSAIMMVGEQPGDNEDEEGRPFVGPAGQLLRRAFKDVGLEARQVYLTNVVKHFKWEPRGKRRLHAKPSARDIRACRPWLEAEFRLVAPKVLVCLGATAVRAICGPAVKVTRARGHLFASSWSEHTLVTLHPSALLRMPSHQAREAAYAAFVADLGLLRRYLEASVLRPDSTSAATARCMRSP